MRRLIHLARHGAHGDIGHVLSGRSAMALSAEGRREAGALALSLRGMPIAAIHSSPTRRAAETAEIVGRMLGLPVVFAAALDEVDFGAFAGRAFVELDAGDPEWQRWNAERSTARCPGGETMAEAVSRADAYIESVARADDRMLFVTHCDIIRGVIAHRLGLSLDRLFAFDCATASLTTVMLDGASARLVSLNERAGVVQPSAARSASTSAITPVQSPVFA